MIELYFISIGAGLILWNVFSGKIESVGQALFWLGILCCLFFETHFSLNMTNKNMPLIVETKDGKLFAEFYKDFDRMCKENKRIEFPEPISKSDVVIKGERLKYNGIWYVKDAFQND